MTKKIECQLVWEDVPPHLQSPKPQRGNWWGRDRTKWAFNQYAKGRPMKDIALALGITRHTLYSNLRMHGFNLKELGITRGNSSRVSLGDISVQYNKLTDEERQKIYVEANLQRKTVADIALTALLESLE